MTEREKLLFFVFRIENVRVFLPEKEPDEPEANDSDVSTES